MKAESEKTPYTSMQRLGVKKMEVCKRVTAGKEESKSMKEAESTGLRTDGK